MKHRKPPDERRTDVIRCRITPGQRVLFSTAAQRAGLTVSAWLVERAVRAARLENHEAEKMEE
jgi:uncharacterized protein (DUF1778 family)